MSKKYYNINDELINQELTRWFPLSEYSYIEITKDWIKYLFKNYYCHEICENFYDSGPDCDKELLYASWDYNHITNGTYDPSKKYSKKEYTMDELKEANDKVVKLYEDYEQKRIEFCNWQEPHFKGNWGATQKDVDRFAKNVLMEIKNINDDKINKKDRLFYHYDEKNDEIQLYWYGRDYDKVDYWLVFYNKKRKER